MNLLLSSIIVHLLSNNTLKCFQCLLYFYVIIQGSDIMFQYNVPMSMRSILIKGFGGPSHPSNSWGVSYSDDALSWHQVGQIAGGRVNGSNEHGPLTKWADVGSHLYWRLDMVGQGTYYCYFQYQWKYQQVNLI